MLGATTGAVPAGCQAGLIGRVTDWSNYIGVGFNYGSGDGKGDLVKRVDGTFTAITPSAAVLAADAVVELVLNGTSISVRQRDAGYRPADHL